jgi:two-component SAPR family response regulator
MTGRSESAIHSFTLPDDQRGLRETTKPALSNPSDPAVPEPDRSSAGNADSLSILCLGPFRVYRDKHMIGDWHSLKGLLILKYMVRHHKTPVAKDVLMDVFWPEADQEVARRNLHQAIYNLRQMLRRGQPDFRPILFENDCYLSRQCHICSHLKKSAKQLRNN